MSRGEEVHGVLHQANAATITVIPIYIAGSDVARTLASTDRIVVTDIQVVVGATGGDVYVYIGDLAAIGTGDTVIRGTVAANGGIAMSFIETHRWGKAGKSAYLLGPADVADVVFTGYILGT